MSHATRRRRLPAFVATAALVATSLPMAIAPAAAAEATARSIDDGCPESRVPDAGFNDTDGHLFERVINCVAWYDITTGNSSGGYGVRDDVRRGPMAAFLVRLIEATGELLDPSPPSAFDDVVGTVFEKPINQLAQIGVVSGSRDADDFDNDGDTDELIYRPNDVVRRDQMATFINNAHGAVTGVKISSADDFFTDDNGTPHEGSINAIASVGIASGVTATTYGPGRTVTRPAMAAFLAREIDYMVELGVLTPPVQGAADVVLDSMEVNQGRQVIGQILTEDGVPVQTATVDICDGESGVNVPLNEDNFSFAFTMPFSAEPGLCELDFDIVLGNDRRELESQVITVVETEKVLLGPELVSISIVTVGPENVTIRYEFNAATTLNQAVEASKFRLYGFGGQQFSAISATRVGDFSVEAVFTADQYYDSTTGGIAQFAVQDQDGYQVAEYAFGLRDVALVAGETEYPDLTGAVANGNAVTFTFDAAAFGVAATDFTAVYSSNGVTTQVDGGAITNGGDGSTSFTVTFTPPESGGVILRGVIKANSIASAAEGTQGNPRQAEDVEGPSQFTSPHLTSLILDQANNQVQFVFSEAVINNSAEPEPCDPPFCVGGDDVPGRGVSIYDINGASVTTHDVVQGSNNTLIATFGAGEVTGLIQGGSVDAGVAKAARNETLLNGIDEQGRQNTFKAGQTAAPDLLKVTKVTDANGDTRLTYTFDQSVAKTTGNPIGDFLLYSQDNTRKIITRADCVAAGVEINCTLTNGSDDFLFASTAVYASVSYAAVNAGGNAKFNPEGGFVIG